MKRKRHRQQWNADFADYFSYSQQLKNTWQLFLCLKISFFCQFPMRRQRNSHLIVFSCQFQPQTPHLPLAKTTKRPPNCLRTLAPAGSPKDIKRQLALCWEGCIFAQKQRWNEKDSYCLFMHNMSVFVRIGFCRIIPVWWNCLQDTVGVYGRGDFHWRF